MKPSFFLISKTAGYGSVIDTTKNTLINIGLYVGTHFNYGPVKFQYGLGLEYDSWKRELSVIQIETYKWYSYVPYIGLIYKYNDFSVGVGYKYHHSFKSEMDYEQYVFNLGPVITNEIYVPVSYDINDQFSVNLEIGRKYQKINSSKNLNIGSGTYFEPMSKNEKDYLKFGISYKF